MFRHLLGPSKSRILEERNDSFLTFCVESASGRGQRYGRSQRRGQGNPTWRITRELLQRGPGP